MTEVQILLDQNGSRLEWLPAFLTAVESEQAMVDLHSSVPWSNHTVRMFGRSMPSPRMSCWMGEPEALYRYSGQDYAPLPWLPRIQTWRMRLEQSTGAHFNSVLLNLYRDGKDHMGWHADDEPELGPEPTIASLSLGAARDFVLKPRAKPCAERIVVPLASGDLLLMRGCLQRDWLHALPVRKRVGGPRINLTWRRIFVRPHHKPTSPGPS